MVEKGSTTRIPLAAVVVVLSLALGFFTTTEFVTARGYDYIATGPQLERHLDILSGVAGNPWQYRVLAPLLIERWIGALTAWKVPDPVAIGFISFRIVQDSLILMMLFVYLRTLRLSPASSLVGMAILAWGIGTSHFDSDLMFNTFFDVLFYLLAAWLVLREKYWFVVPVTFLAALNRETSGLIPLLVFFAPLARTPRGSIRDAAAPFFASALVYAAVFYGLRLAFGPQELLVSYGHRPGLDLLTYNLGRLLTWRQLVATLSIVPLVAVMGYRQWLPELKAFFWVVVPIWFAVHASASVMAETRLFLVPQALVFIPGALLALEQARPEQTEQSTTEASLAGEDSPIIGR